jgi:hypothetical protein
MIVVSTVRCEIGCVDSAFASRAAEWAQSFHAGVSAWLEEGCACLSSGEHCEHQLRAIWLSSLANERLHARAARQRDGALAALMQ